VKDHCPASWACRLGWGGVEIEPCFFWPAREGGRCERTSEAHLEAVCARRDRCVRGRRGSGAQATQGQPVIGREDNTAAASLLNSGFAVSRRQEGEVRVTGGDENFLARVLEVWNGLHGDAKAVVVPPRA
jgi:hypothetical protein